MSDPGAGDLKVFLSSGKYKLRSERGFHLHEPYGIAYHRWSKETLVVDRMFSCLFVHAPSGEVKDIISRYSGGRSSGDGGGDVDDEADGSADVTAFKQPNYTTFDYAGETATDYT